MAPGSLGAWTDDDDPTGLISPRRDHVSGYDRREGEHLARVEQVRVGGIDEAGAVRGDQPPPVVVDGGGCWMLGHGLHREAPEGVARRHDHLVVAATRPARRRRARGGGSRRAAPVVVVVGSSWSAGSVVGGAAGSSTSMTAVPGGRPAGSPARPAEQPTPAESPAAPCGQPSQDERGSRHRRPRWSAPKRRHGPRAAAGPTASEEPRRLRPGRPRRRPASAATPAPTSLVPGLDRRPGRAGGARQGARARRPQRRRPRATAADDRDEAQPRRGSSDGLEHRHELAGRGAHRQRRAGARRGLALTSACAPATCTRRVRRPASRRRSSGGTRTPRRCSGRRRAGVASPVAVPVVDEHLVARLAHPVPVAAGRQHRAGHRRCRCAPRTAGVRRGGAATRVTGGARWRGIVGREPVGRPRRPAGQDHPTATAASARHRAEPGASSTDAGGGPQALDRVDGSRPSPAGSDPAVGPGTASAIAAASRRAVGRRVGGSGDGLVGQQEEGTAIPPGPRAATPPPSRPGSARRPRRCRAARPAARRAPPRRRPVVAGGSPSPKPHSTGRPCSPPARAMPSSRPWTIPRSCRSASVEATPAARPATCGHASARRGRHRPATVGGAQLPAVARRGRSARPATTPGWRARSQPLALTAEPVGVGRGAPASRPPPGRRRSRRSPRPPCHGTY